MSEKRGKLYPFAWYTSPQKVKGCFVYYLHQLRDFQAAIENIPSLLEMGYEFGEISRNPPDPRLQAHHCPDFSEDQLIVDLDLFSPNDLILIFTRPPINDQDEDQQRHIIRSHSNLENLLLDDVLNPYLRLCSRRYVQMGEKLASCLPTTFANRANIEFRMNNTADYWGRYAPYNQLAKDPHGDWEASEQNNLTAGYALFLKEAWVGGPGLLTVFGVSGTSNLLWAHYLRTRFQRNLKLDQSRFIMGEFEVRDVPRSPFLRFSDSWPAKLIADKTIDHKFITRSLNTYQKLDKETLVLNAKIP